MQLDFTILAIIFIVCFAYGFWKGRGALLAVVVSLYPAAVLYSAFPYTQDITVTAASLTQAPFTRLIIFALFVLLVRFCFRRLFSGGGFDYGYGSNRLLSIAIASIVSTGLIVALQYHLSGLRSLHAWNISIVTLISSSTAYFIWLVLPMAVILFA